MLSAREDGLWPRRLKACNPPSEGIAVMRLFGCILRRYRSLSRSSGAKLNLQALYRYRGPMAMQTTSGIVNQKYAARNKKWSLPKIGVMNQPGEIKEYIA
jgi:hypothetical protein